MMNNRHLPAGQQNMQQDMSRRRTFNPNQQYPPATPMYNGYMQAYPTNYYPQQPYSPQPYHNQGIPPPYAPYPQHNVRSPPPSMQHHGYPPTSQQNYPRPQQSSVVATPYQPPPPQTPPPVSSPAVVSAAQSPQTTFLMGSPQLPAPSNFRVSLPWFSHPDASWPARKLRRKKKQASQLSADPVQLPVVQQEQQPDSSVEPEESTASEPVSSEETAPRPETPSTTEAADSTTPTTPASVQQSSQPAASEITPGASKQKKSTLPAIPLVPALPKVIGREAGKPTEKVFEKLKADEAVSVSEVEQGESKTEAKVEAPVEESKVASPPTNAWAQKKQWSGLFGTAATSAAVNGGSAMNATPEKSTAESMAEVLRSFDAVSNNSKVAFLEPRGLVNTGNMCYMNSVLQVLVFCTPFYSFLSQVSKVAYSFKGTSPLVDAMVMFMGEYKVIDSAPTEQLPKRLKDNELEQYGEAFTPDFVYDVIKSLPRFSTMRRGHQQDAEEFLGFLLEGLHDECAQVMRASSSNATSAMATPTNGPASPVSDTASIAGSNSAKENGWLEVGPKQKAAVTRTSGMITTSSPLSKIFGGNLRSELRVPGLKDSVTLEPYQPLQLDIGADNVNNIIDALKGLTRSETLHGDFKSPKGNVTAIKQVFIETLPPVLILHLKRFQYDNKGGTQKIWKKVGYPLELEIPKEVFPRQKRIVYAHGGLPRYRLTAVVYHHGNNASGGHYTVDVRRQDGREWIRLDDTSITRVRKEDVAEAGSEEDPKVLAAALDAQKKDGPTSGNLFAAIDEDREAHENDEGWKQASGPGKKWSNVLNGASTPKTKSDKFSFKDNKVAYLLFYQKI